MQLAETLNARDRVGPARDAYWGSTILHGGMYELEAPAVRAGAPQRGLGFDTGDPARRDGMSMGGVPPFLRPSATPNVRQYRGRVVRIVHLLLSRDDG